ncbi:MAG: tetratricopeptide repeat protein, partial [bacterium]
MKLRALTIIGALLMVVTLSAQTLTDVINEFNEGVAKINSQEYEASLEHFNQVLTMAEVVGDSATDMKEKNNEESRQKATRYLMQSYMVEGQRSLKNGSYDEAIDFFEKALQMNPDLYQAHQGKGMVYMEEDEIDSMLEEFNLAKEGATASNKPETVDEINGVIDSYFNKFIMEEMEMVDPEDLDYTYVIEACDKALAANPGNPRALYHMALIKNKEVEYEAAIDYALQALEHETEEVWISAINFELGSAYQNTVEYEKACEALQNVVEEPFLSRAE